MLSCLPLKPSLFPLCRAKTLCQRCHFPEDLGKVEARVSDLEILEQLAEAKQDGAEILEEGPAKDRDRWRAA